MEDKKTDHELKILLDRKAEIEKTVQEQYIRKITVMFTDMKGFTPLVKTKGPIAGAAVVHKHNEILMDAINTNNPLFVKAEGGDETMSVYNESTDAIKAAIHVQKSLKKYNGNKPKEEQIQVKIGLDCGDCIVKERDAIGVAVNIAKRLESTAKADEILVSENLYRAVKNSDELIFRLVDIVELKGIGPTKVFRVIWDWDGEKPHSEKMRGIEHLQKFVLEASISGDRLRISSSDKTEGEERPVKSYREIRFNDIKIKEYTKGVIDLLNRANKRGGKISNELLIKLKEYGRLLFDELIPVEIKEKLLKTHEKNLFINIDDKLVHIPWELLYDGKDFLCQRFSIGRSVSTKQPVSAGPRAIGRPLKMQILADPRGDLKASYEEGVSIKDEIGKLDDWMNIFLMTT
ncbi:MAG: hypothetical protein HY754_04640, partial [Nitrospirae bacterium]|nr:hypothetical protein [Nitrospirota bacterium]